MPALLTNAKACNLTCECMRQDVCCAVRRIGMPLLLLLLPPLNPCSPWEPPCPRDAGSEVLPPVAPKKAWFRSKSCTMAISWALGGTRSRCCSRLRCRSSMCACTCRKQQNSEAARTLHGGHLICYSLQALSGCRLCLTCSSPRLMQTSTCHALSPSATAALPGRQSYLHAVTPSQSVQHPQGSTHHCCCDYFERCCCHSH